MAVKFQTNIPLTLTFPYGDFRETTSQYGQQFQYTVEIAGQRDKLFATPLLHQELQTVGVGPGAVLTVAKVEAEGNRKGWVVQSDEAEEMAASNGKDATAHASTNGTPNTNGLPADSSPIASAKEEASAKEGHHPPTPPDFADMQTLMAECLKASWSAWQGVDDGDFQFASDDVRGVGITLFIECGRKGILPQPVEEGLPF